MQVKKCAIYTRVSTDNQVEVEFNSCESQETKIKSFISSQERMEIYKVYSDLGYTGANINRPALLQMIEDIKVGKINIVISYKIDRLTRSPKDFYQLVELFDKYNVDFISVTERFDTSTPAGRLLRNIMLTFAQFERELTSERTKDKMLQRAEKGMWNGGGVPFGYKRENKKLIADKKETDVLKKIFEIYVGNGSLFKTYNELKRKDIKNRDNNVFTKGVLSYILRNPVYIGKIKHAEKFYQGIHEPIISENLFELAQKCHKKKVKKLSVQKKYPFAGLISCKECNSSMTPTFTNKKSNGKTKRYFYYRCISTLKKDWDICVVKQVNADRLERYIFENLERISLDKQYLDGLILGHKNINEGCYLGFEPLENRSELSSERVQNVLERFIKEFGEAQGIEKNLLCRKYINSIIYSKENIHINLYFSTNSHDFEIPKNSIFSSGFGAGGREIKFKKSTLSIQNSQFDKKSLAPHRGRR